jgi:MFS family permease
MSELAGPYVAMVVVLALASLVILLGLRPDPRDVGRKIADDTPDTAGGRRPARSASQILRTPGAIVAVSAMMIAQVAMAIVMDIGTLHMRRLQRPLTDISVVISAHAFGMFALSAVAGRLTDRWGRGPVILSGTAMLVLSCALAPLVPDFLLLAATLFLLGVGWSFCYIGGSALLSDQLAPDERAKTQGASDLLIGLATAGANLGSGPIFARMGYPLIGLVGTVASLAPMALTAWWMIATRRSGSHCRSELAPDRTFVGLSMPARCRG